MKRYCFDRSVAETFVESSVVAMTVVAAMYFGHVPLVGMTALWCLALFGIAAYRLLSLHSQIAQELNTNRTDTLQADADVSDAYMAALANALT